jgi:hypothetical protein
VHVDAQGAEAIQTDTPGDGGRGELVLGVARGYDGPAIAPFVRSLRDSGYRGDVALFCDMLGGGAAELLDAHGVRRLPYRSTLARASAALAGFKKRRPKRFDRWQRRIALAVASAAALIEDVVPRGAIVPALGGLSANLVPLGEPMLRHWLYIDFLAREPYERVLLADVRDVVFQRDPFEDWRGPAGVPDVCFGLESIPMGASDFMRLAYNKMYGKLQTRLVAGRPVACAGVILGRNRPLRELMWRICMEMRRTFHGQATIADQVCLHRVIWRRRERLESGRITLLPPGGAWVAHLSTIPRAEIREDASGRILGGDGRPVAVVHQFDRHPDLAAAIERRYGAAVAAVRG